MGAIAIVIAMSDSVPIISRFCRELLGYENYKNTVIEGVRGEECNIEAICYGCSILITTVPSLCRLMDNPFMINNDKVFEIHLIKRKKKEKWLLDIENDYYLKS